MDLELSALAAWTTAGLVFPAVLLYLLFAAAVSFGMRSRPLVAQALVLLPPLVFTTATGLHLLLGPQISRHPQILAMRAAVIVGSAIAFLAATVIYRAARQRDWLRKGGLVFLPGLAALIAVVDQRVFPGTYPRFHLGLMVALIACGTLFGSLWAQNSRRRALALALLLIAIGAGGTWQIGSKKLPGSHTGLRAALIDSRAMPVAARLQALLPEAWLFPQLKEEDPSKVRPLESPAPVDFATLDAQIPSRRELSVVVITLDAVRAGHLGFMGYARPTSPRLDALAARSIVFENAVSQYPSSQLSLSSLFSGVYPSRNSVLRRRERPELLKAPLEHPPLARRLKEAGWRTAGVCSLIPHIYETHFPFLREGMETWHVNAEPRSLDGRQVTGHAKGLLTGFQNERFFLWLHYFDAHDPYDVHPEFGFGNDAIDAYDSEIGYVDRQVGDVLDFLEERDLLDRCILVVHSDHGEEFMEHGGRFHGTSLHREQIDVPLLISVPGLTPRRITSPVGLVDVVPTIMEILGRDAGPVQGESLLRWMLKDVEAPTSPRAALAELREPRALSPSVDALLTEDHKLILHRKSGATELYDRRTDIGETNNLSRKEPTLTEELLTLLRRKRAQIEGTPGTEEVSSEEQVFRNTASTDHERQNAMDRLLARGDNDQVSMACVALLNSNRHTSVELALRTLILMPSPLAREGIARHLNSDHMPVRLRAALAAAANMDPPDLEHKLVPWISSEHPAVAVTGAIALLLGGHSHGRALVEAALPSLSGEARVFARLGLAMVGDEESLQLRRSLLQEPCAILEFHAFAVRGATSGGHPEDLVDLYSMPLRPGGSIDYLPSDSLIDIATHFPSRAAVPLLRRALIRRDGALRTELLKWIPEKDLLRPWIHHPMERLWAEDPSDSLRAAHALLRAARRSADDGLLEWGLLFEAWTHLMAKSERAAAGKILDDFPTTALRAEDPFAAWISRLPRLSQSEASPAGSVELAFATQDLSYSKSGEPWVAEVLLRHTSAKGGLPGGLSGVALQTVLSFDGATENYRVSQPLRTGGLLPGEVTRFLVVVPSLPTTSSLATIRIQLSGVRGPNPLKNILTAKIPVR
jgi:arylsulfatase A-like enzyme